MSYLTEASNCCDEEEPVDNDCCQNESHIILNAADFTFDIAISELPLQSCTDLFYFTDLNTKFNLDQKTNCTSQFIESPPPRLQQELLLSATFLRI